MGLAEDGSLMSEKSPTPPSPRPLDITDVVGHFGLWQKIIVVIITLQGFPLAWQHLFLTFGAPNVDHWCRRPQDSPDNLTTQKWKELGIPLVAKPGGVVGYSQCNAYPVRWKNSGEIIRIANESMPCSEWEFDRSFYQSTVIGEWDLVCSKEWLISFSLMIYIFGFVIGMPLSGHLSDKFGRRPVILAFGVLYIFSSFLCLFSVSFVMFIFCRLLISLGIAGIESPSFVLLVEIVGGDYRSHVGIARNFGWVLGYITLPGIAWLTRDWFYLQLAIVVPSILITLLLWFLPESPRWLIAKKRYSEAEEVLGLIAKRNRVQLPEKDIIKQLNLYSNNNQEEDEDESKNASLFDLLTSANLKERTFILMFCWFAISFTYYGLSYNTNEFGGNPFVNFILSGVVEFPAYLVSIVILERYGRRISQMTVLMFGGLTCFLAIPFTGDLHWVRLTCLMTGKFLLTACYAIVYVYSAEIFPTVVRNIGVGVCCFCGKMGSSLSPYIKEFGRSTHPAAPFLAFGSIAVGSSLLILLLPETKDKMLVDTLKEKVENSSLRSYVSIDSCNKNAKHEQEVDVKFSNQSSENIHIPTTDEEIEEKCLAKSL